MTIKQNGGVFGRNPTFNDVDVEGDLTVSGVVNIKDINIIGDVDVTGTVTADGLTVDTDTLYVDSSNHRVGIGTSSPATGLDVTTTNYTYSGTTYDIYGILGLTSGGVRLGGDSSNDDSVIGTTGTGNMQFVTYNGSAWGSRITLDNTGNVGIGTDSPATNLHVTDGGTPPAISATYLIAATSATNAGIAINAGNTSASIIALGDTDSQDIGVIRYDHSGNSMRLHTSATEVMRLDSSGHAIIPAGVTLGTAAGVYAAAKTLDDYEEGTFEAALTAGGGTITLGYDLMRYTKIGRVVTVSGLIICSAISSPTGDLTLTGLPFTVNNNTDGEYSGLSTGSIHIQLLASTITGNPQLNISNNATSIAIDGFNGTTRTSIAANISATTQMRICATYTT
jgi:hypothetical protein